MSPLKHAVISLSVGLFYGYLFAPEMFFIFVATAFFAGTLIDIDHFFVGRLFHGDWRFLKATFSSFWASVSNIQSVMNDSVDMPAEYRLLSHSVILVALLSLNFANASLLVDAMVISVCFHIVSDLFADCFMW